MTRTSKTIRVRLFVVNGASLVQALFISLQVIKVSGNGTVTIEKYNFIDRDRTDTPNESKLQLFLKNYQKMR